MKKMLVVVIFGAPGSGKGTQSEKLIEKYGLKHISTGDALRCEIKKGSELGKMAENYISKGELLPDNIIVDMLANVLDKSDTTKGVIFDGFPRTIPQAEALKDMLAKRGTEVSIVLGLEVEEKELVTRMLKRGESSGRSDDNIETIKSRLDVYKKQTDPLKGHYKKEGKYSPILGTGSVEEIFERIKKAIALLD